MEALRRVWSQLQGVWAGMSSGRRVMTVGVTALALALVGVLVYTQTHVEYRPLYTGLAPEDAQKLTAALQEKAIPYRLEAGGSTISVPAERLAQARVDIAAEGVTLSSGKGFEIIDSSPLGMTPAVLNINFTRALQSELGRTISQLEPVAQARVHIVRPESTPFVRDQKPATASVVLRLKPRAQLNRSTAAAIVSLVSRGVEGLSPENVTIVDTQGRLLSDPRPAEDKAQGLQDEYRRSLESDLTAKAENLLRRHLGVSRVIVAVTAAVNLQRIKEKSEIFNPEGKVVLAMRTSTQKSTGGGGPRGVAGTSSNVGRSARGSTGGGGGTSQQEKTEEDYGVSKTLREQENRANVVDRLTVAAMVDLSGQPETGAKLTLADARDLIKQAIGFKEGRDEIKVTDVRLGGDGEPALVPDPEQERAQRLLQAVRNGSLIVGLLLLLVLGILVLKRLLAERRKAAAALASAVPPSTREVDEVRKLAESDPDLLARLLTQLLEGPGVMPRYG